MGPAVLGRACLSGRLAARKWTSVARFEQYEVWVQGGQGWELAAAFRDFETARAVALARGSHVRLLHATYDGNTLVVSEVLAELGGVRREP